MAKRVLGILFLLIILSCETEPPAPLPNANFYVDNAECASPCYVHFYDQSYSAVRWNWEFGNSMTSNLQNDSVQYAMPGNYDITLTVWNEDDVQDKITKTIYVF